MKFVSVRPNGPLGEFVERLWQVNDTPRHPRESILPSGTVELVVNLQEDEFRICDRAHPGVRKRFSGAMVSGPYHGSFLIDAQQHASVVGVHFKPAGAFPFFGPAISDLANTHLDLETLWGRGARQLRERLCAAREPSERFSLLEKALLAHCFRPLEHHYSVKFGLEAFLRDNSNRKIREIVQKTGISHRRFIQVFAREVGLSPKVFCLVRRFQNLLTATRRTKVPDWSQLAWECGYFDQSHLIHDFRFFSNLSPTEFLRQRSDRAMENHLPIAAR